jgi:transposase
MHLRSGQHPKPTVLHRPVESTGTNRRRDQRERRAGRPGRKPGFDANAYRRRNVVERCVNRLKQWRGIATRYEKRAVNYRAMVVIAALMVWLAS